MSNIKILIAHHTRPALVKSDILVPVQTGSALAKEILPNMQRDDEGENRSELNPKYCEVSAQYWGWKNQDKLGHPDFIGLMHDRRHFLFNTALPVPNKNITWLPGSAVYMFPPICDGYLPYVTDEIIRSYFPKYDCMVLKAYDIASLGGKATVRDRFLYSKGMTYEIFDTWYNTVLKLFPQYEPELKAFTAGSKYYLCNMFVLRKDLFEEYNSFLFTVLDEVDKQIDSTDFSVLKMRFLGLLGEYMLSLFVMKLKKRADIKLVEVDGVFFMDPNERKYKKLFRYGMLSHLLFGKTRCKYQKKYNELKAEKEVLNFFK